MKRHVLFLLTALSCLVFAAAAFASSDARLALGDAFPPIAARDLAGGDVTVPIAKRPTLLLMGFARGSREDVEKYVAQIERVWLADTTRFEFFSMPMVGSGGKLFSGMITGAMRSKTEPRWQRHSLPLYRDAGLWKKRLGVASGDIAILVLVGRDGRLAWQGAGPFSEARWRELEAALASATR